MNIMGIKERILDFLNDNPKINVRGDILDVFEDVSAEVITKIAQRLKEEKMINVERKGKKTHYILTKLGKITTEARKRREQKREEDILKSTENHNSFTLDEEKYKEKDAEQDLEIYFSNDLYSDIIASEKILSLDLAEIQSFKPELYDFAYKYPEDFLKVAAKVLENIDRASVDEKYLPIRIRDSNAEPLPLASFNRSENAFKLIVFEGMVSTIELVSQYVTFTEWCCMLCGNKIYKLTDRDGIIRKPHICECGNKQQFETSMEHYEDRQYLNITERELTPSPECVVGYVHSEMVNDIEPQQRKLLTGNIIRFYAISEMKKNVNNKQLQANTRMVARIINYELVAETFGDLQQSEEDIRKIKEFAKNNDVLSTFASSICSKLIGKDYQLIKKALILQFFGGTVNKKKGRHGIIHLGLIGDHGKGKSSFLEEAISFAPKALYTSGVSSTGKGIMASLDYNEVTKVKLLRPGPYIRCNNGLICIDEIDKMKFEDLQYLGEALAKQKFTFSKAGIHAELVANASCIFCANPKNFRFDEFSQISSQIEIPVNIRDRFDLTFILKDVPDPDTDFEICMSMIFDEKKKKKYIDPDFARKYISYARSNCNPVMPYDVAKYISTFYSNFRNPKGRKNGDPISSTPRQANSISVLSEASAKSRLSDVVSIEDAKIATYLFRQCMMQIGYDPETGQFDNLGMSQGLFQSYFHSKDRIIETIKRIGEKNKGVASLEEVIEDIKSYGLKLPKIMHMMDRLKSDGDIMMVGQDKVRAM